MVRLIVSRWSRAVHILGESSASVDMLHSGSGLGDPSFDDASKGPTTPVERLEETLSKGLHERAGVAIHRDLKAGGSNPEARPGSEPRERDASDDDVLAKVTRGKAKFRESLLLDQQHLPAAASEVVVAFDPLIGEKSEGAPRCHGNASPWFDEELLNDTLQASLAV